MRLAQATYNQSIRDRARDEFFNRGVVYSEEDILKMRYQFQAEASPCPKCHMLVHPDNIERHNQVHHPVEIQRVVIPSAPVICDTPATKFHVGQTVKIAGTSHTLSIAEVKTLDSTWYRFEIEAGDVQRFWVEEARLTSAETILPVPVKRYVEAIKYPLAVRGCTAIVPYGMFLTVA